MAKLLAEFSLYLEITDHLALAKAAAERAVADGAYDTEDAYIDEVGADDLTTHLRMLLDPSTLAGCSILDSAAELNQSFPAEDSDDEGEEWSCDNCGETAMDGSGECVTCGQQDEEAN